MGFRLSANHPFLGGAHGFVGAVDTAEPTAGAAYTFLQLRNRSLDMVLSSLSSFDRYSPANPFVAGERRDALPRHESLWRRKQRFPQIHR